MRDPEKSLEEFEIIASYETLMDTQKWVNDIPNINFHEEWDVKIIPPFGGAVVRFRVNDRVSVYLDCYSRLGLWDGPYWEIHPVDDDVARCAMDDVAMLLAYIETSLKETDEDDGLITVT